jgi:hypothetical protein
VRHLLRLDGSSDRKLGAWSKIAASRRWMSKGGSASPTRRRSARGRGYRSNLPFSPVRCRPTSSGSALTSSVTSTSPSIARILRAASDAGSQAIRRWIAPSRRWRRVPVGGTAVPEVRDARWPVQGRRRHRRPAFKVVLPSSAGRITFLEVVFARACGSHPSGNVMCHPPSESPPTSEPDDPALPLGAPGRRPLVNLCVVHRSEEIEAEEHELNLALVAVVGGSWPHVSLPEVRNWVANGYGIPRNSFKVRRFQSEDFIITFSYYDDMLYVLNDPAPCRPRRSLSFSSVGAGNSRLLRKSFASRCSSQSVGFQLMPEIWPRHVSSSRRHPCLRLIYGYSRLKLGPFTKTYSRVSGSCSYRNQRRTTLARLCSSSRSRLYTRSSHRFVIGSSSTSWRLGIGGRRRNPRLALTLIPALMASRDQE